MPAAARGLGSDTVLSKTGVGKGCTKPVEVVTGTCSSDVYVNGIGCVRQDDIVGFHLRPPCVPDVSTLSTYSSTVFINGKGAGRIGDQYTADNIIISGSNNVFFGG